VRLAQVPADRFRVHNAKRVDTVVPIMNNHRDKQCTVYIVSRSMASRSETVLAS
jgi:hypothetical protein